MKILGHFSFHLLQISVRISDSRLIPTKRELHWNNIFGNDSFTVPSRFYRYAEGDQVLAYLNECHNKSSIHKRNQELWGYLKVLLCCTYFGRFWYCLCSENASWPYLRETLGYFSFLRKEFMLLLFTFPASAHQLFFRAKGHVSREICARAPSRLLKVTSFLCCPCHATVVETVDKVTSFFIIRYL